jgi:hypothetical protein
MYAPLLQPADPVKNVKAPSQKTTSESTSVPFDVHQEYVEAMAPPLLWFRKRTTFF